jgi:hypothetical protein
MKHTQESVAEFLDYMDSMDELEMRREIELYERSERIKNALTSIIIILGMAVVVIGTYQTIRG